MIERRQTACAGACEGASVSCRSKVAVIAEPIVWQAAPDRGQAIMAFKDRRLTAAPSLAIVNPVLPEVETDGLAGLHII